MTSRRRVPEQGGPVDAVPRRVPVRPRRWDRRPAADGAPGGDGRIDRPPAEDGRGHGAPSRAEARPVRWRRPAVRPPRRRPPRPPDPLAGLAVAVTLSLLAAFFGWVSASPLWVAAGHATDGTVVITECTGAGLTQRCRGDFRAARDRFAADGVRVSGVPGERTTTGSALPARMTGRDGGVAYADAGVGRHLRWLLGLLLVVACGAGIARWTGATRLPDPRHRRWAVWVALGGPLLITAGFLTAAW